MMPRGESQDEHDAFRALAQCVADFICLATADGQLLYLNPAGRKLLGLDDGTPTPQSLQACYSDRSWAVLREAVGPAVEATGRWEGRLQLRHLQTGQLRSMGTIIYPIGPEIGAPLVIVHRDRHDAVRNPDLEQFAYAASHDLQEPLRKIRAFGERLEQKCSATLNDTGRDCIQRMQNAAARMQHLIEGLLMLSRVTTHALDFLPVHLDEVAKAVVRDLAPQIEQLHAQVEIGPLPTIVAEPMQMRQLLFQLVANALKFHRADEPPRVRIEGQLLESGMAGGAGAACRLLIEDNGIGFEEQYREQIFGIFQRLHPRDVYEGIGIGLSICRRIVAFHGGTITARSVLGKGSAFEVVLPSSVEG